MKTITVKEAIQQGYEYFGYKDREFQHAQSLKDISEEDFNTNETLILFNKKASYRSISAEEIQELIFDYMYDNDEMADDTEFMNDIFSESDFKPLSELINKKLSDYPYYFLTDIELTK